MEIASGSQARQIVMSGAAQVCSFLNRKKKSYSTNEECIEFEMDQAHGVEAGSRKRDSYFQRHGFLTESKKKLIGSEAAIRLLSMPFPTSAAKWCRHGTWNRWPFLFVFFSFFFLSNIPKIKWKKSEEKRNVRGRWVWGLASGPPQENPSCVPTVPHVPPSQIRGGAAVPIVLSRREDSEKAEFYVPGARKNVSHI